MPSWDMRIVSGTYKTLPEENIMVELYGHTRDGRSIVVRDLVKDLSARPYCYIVSDDPELRTHLEGKREVLKVEPRELFHRGEARKVWRVTVRLPRHVKLLREDFRIKGEFLAADIPFYLRYIYDRDLGSCVRAHGKESKGNYHTKLVVDLERWERIDAFNPDLRVLSFDIENSLKDISGKEVLVDDVEEETEAASDDFFNKRILTICCVLQAEGRMVASGSFKGGERKILEDFNKFIQEQDPDVISGYNIEGYDLRVVEKRANELRVPLNWGRDGSLLEGRRDQKYNKPIWNVTGRMIMDTWWAVKMDLRPKQETLNAVSMQLLGGETKLDVDPRRIDEEWAKDEGKVLEYCKRDAELALRILNKLERVRKVMDLATVSKLPLVDVMKGRSSLLIDSILVREADRSGVAVPMTRNFRDDEEAIEGGYVHEIEPGLYHWVCVLDFKSMYPSIIIAKNICFTTLSPNGTIVSPNHVRYLDKTQREGLLPNILVRLMQERDDTKRRMRQAKDADEQAYYEGLQQAIKILDELLLRGLRLLLLPLHRQEHRLLHHRFRHGRPPRASSTAWRGRARRSSTPTRTRYSCSRPTGTWRGRSASAPPWRSGSPRKGACWSSRRSWRRSSPTARRSATSAAWSGPRTRWSSAATRCAGPTPSTCNRRR